MRKSIVVMLLAAAVIATAAVAGEGTGVETMRGEITAVDSVKGSFTVKPDRDETKSMTLHVDEHTKFVQDGKVTGFDELSTGDRVTVNYKQDEDGRLVALSVGIG